MSDSFEQMVDAAQGFFPELARNNSKDWFAERKAFYEGEIRKPAVLFADLVAQDLTTLTGESLRAKVFRIYRDVRFLKDKTPLNTHLHVSWSPGTPEAPTWFWGLSPEYFILGMGYMGLDAAGLQRFRALVDAEGDALTDAVSEAEQNIGAQISDFGPDPLKRVPKPYAPDHPHAELLKRKAFALHAPMPDSWRSDGLVASVRQTAHALMPVHEILRR
jgi:uncharacterized protein (TIGR02453 family)